jgi:hypothetical protein
MRAFAAKRQEKSNSSESLLKWWAHLDSNQGPKDYEQLQEIKPQLNQEVTHDLQGCGSKCGSRLYEIQASGGLLIRGSVTYFLF